MLNGVCVWIFTVISPLSSQQFWTGSASGSCDYTSGTPSYCLYRDLSLSLIRPITVVLNIYLKEFNWWVPWGEIISVEGKEQWEEETALRGTSADLVGAEFDASHPHQVPSVSQLVIHRQVDTGKVSWVSLPSHPNFKAMRISAIQCQTIYCIHPNSMVSHRKSPGTELACLHSRPLTNRNHFLALWAKKYQDCWAARGAAVVKFKIIYFLSVNI